uniref:DDE-type integrase/transposase/recombinase n=1 Tax=Telluribacter sp. SYSU D00476 TaxID=2811430 RepID=UPI001FF22202
LWQTDFTYFKIKQWGWYYLSTVLDDYSRYILAWELCPSMQAVDVERTVQAALQASSLSTGQRPRILSDNGSAYVSRYLKEYLKGEGIDHVRCAPYHPMTQGKIERYHRSMKNVLLLEHYFSPDELSNRLAEWVTYYNYQRYHDRGAGALTRKRKASGCLLGPSGSDLGPAAKNQAYVNA